MKKYIMLCGIQFDHATTTPAADAPPSLDEVVQVLLKQKGSDTADGRAQNRRVELHVK